MTTKVTSDLFSGLVNPYTRERMEVIMIVNPGRDPLFSCPDTYSTDDFFDTKEECIAAWDRKGGVSGLKRNQPIVCAYTKEPLRLVQGSGGRWHFAGGFNPHLFYSREEFLHFANMRGGVSSYPRPGAGVRVTAVPQAARITKTQRAAAESKAPKLDEAKVHELESRLAANGVRMASRSVSMSIGGKKHRGK